MNTIFKNNLLLLALLTMAVSASAQSQSAPPEIAKVWVGQWLDQSNDANAALNIDAKGNFAFDKKNFSWIGTKTNLPKKAGCYAFYEGLVTKATLTQRLTPDNSSMDVLKKVSDDRFKQIELVCQDAKGDKEKSTDECQPTALFYDQKVIYRALNCKIGNTNHLMVYPFTKR
jgi:phosphate-selective porin